jgi:hypothetical protein
MTLEIRQLFADPVSALFVGHSLEFLFVTLNPVSRFGRRLLSSIVFLLL